ncbi:dipeptidase [Actinoplanes sp. NPDC051851]|uniref:dipeptidase n=1 Tax=Actinoplanes sp. NPDC051851 TaxID=3154753 RepID=UPI003429B0DD
MTWIFDGHNDLAMRLREAHGSSVEGLGTHRPELQTDIPRLRAGGVGAQFWSVYVPSDQPEPLAVAHTMEQIDLVHRLIAAYPNDLELAHTADDVERIVAAGRIASLIGIEGGHCLNRSPGVLRSFARLGVRYVTLTHNHHTAWADSAAQAPGSQPTAAQPSGSQPSVGQPSVGQPSVGGGPTGSGEAGDRGPGGGGLTGEGHAIVREMQRLGVLVDLSHVAPQTMHAALDTATLPVIFSHSGARAVTDHPRNVPDDVLPRLRSNGGVVQVPVVAPFVSPAVLAWHRAADAEWQRLGLPAPEDEWPRAPYAGEPSPPRTRYHDRAGEPRFRPWLAAHPKPSATAHDVANHLDHIRDTIGIDHVGLGGDFDGTFEVPADLPDVASYPTLLAELRTRSWSPADLTKLTHANALRVLRASSQHPDRP